MTSRRAFVRWGLFAGTASTSLLFVVCWAISHYLPGFAGQGELWSLMQGLSAVIATGSLVGSGAFALFQYADARQARHLQIFNDVFERLMSDEHVEARRIIYQELNHNNLDIGEFISALPAHQHTQIKRVLDAFDHLGFLVSQGWLDDPAVLGWVNPIVSKTWERLRPLVQFERSRRGDADYYHHCEYLAIRCSQYNKHGQELIHQASRTLWFSGRIL